MWPNPQSHSLNKFLMGNLFFCAVKCLRFLTYFSYSYISRYSNERNWWGNLHLSGAHLSTQSASSLLILSSTSDIRCLIRSLISIIIFCTAPAPSSTDDLNLLNDLESLNLDISAFIARKRLAAASSIKCLEGLKLILS